MKLAAVAVLLCTIAMAQSSNSTETPKADVIFRNANIYTGLKDRSTFGETQRRAEAMAIRGDRVLAIGGNGEITSPTWCSRPTSSRSGCCSSAARWP